MNEDTEGLEMRGLEGKRVKKSASGCLEISGTYRAISRVVGSWLVRTRAVWPGRTLSANSKPPVFVLSRRLCWRFGRGSE